MSLKKTYSEKKPSCRVTFKLPKADADHARKVTLAGDFNHWDREATPMKMLKNGDFSVSVNLEKGKEYQFRYLLDGTTWVNDNEADRYVPNEFNSENSVIMV
jgi:1,4-alpha-glucan branching enzyme